MAAFNTSFNGVLTVPASPRNPQWRHGGPVLNSANITSGRGGDGANARDRPRHRVERPVTHRSVLGTVQTQDPTAPGWHYIDSTSTAT